MRPSEVISHGDMWLDADVSVHRALRGCHLRVRPTPEAGRRAGDKEAAFSAPVSAPARMLLIRLRLIHLLRLEAVRWRHEGGLCGDKLAQIIRAGSCGSLGAAVTR